MIITFFCAFDHLAVHQFLTDLTDLLLFALVYFFFLLTQKIFVLTYVFLFDF